MTKRKKNQGRHYTTDEWLEFMIEGEIESRAQAVRDGEHHLPRTCYDEVIAVDAFDVMTPALAEQKEAFEKAVEKAIKAWAKKHPFKEDVDEDDLMAAGAPADAYLSLVGAGAGGVFEGEWNAYFVDGDEWSWDDLSAFLDEKLGQYADESGAGSLNDAMMEAVDARFQEVCRAENPKRTKKLKSKLLR